MSRLANISPGYSAEGANQSAASRIITLPVIQLVANTFAKNTIIWKITSVNIIVQNMQSVPCLWSNKLKLTVMHKLN